MLHTTTISMTDNDTGEVFYKSKPFSICSDGDCRFSDSLLLKHIKCLHRGLRQGKSITLMIQCDRFIVPEQRDVL